MPGWLNGPLTVRRWHVIGAAFAVGLVGAVAIVIGHSALENAKKERRRAVAAELRQQKESIERDALSKREVRRIARRQAKLESPSPAELVRVFRSQLAACRGAPTCITEVQRLSTRGPTVAPVAPSPSRPSPPQRQGGGRGGGGNGGGGSPGQPPPPPQSPPIMVKPPPSVPLPCVGVTTPIIGVDCP